MSSLKWHEIKLCIIGHEREWVGNHLLAIFTLSITDQEYTMNTDEIKRSHLLVILNDGEQKMISYNSDKDPLAKWIFG